MHNPNSRSDLDSTLASLRRTKTKRLSGIHEERQHNETDKQAHHALLPIQPIYFKEEIKEKEWIEEVN